MTVIPFRPRPKPPQFQFKFLTVTIETASPLEEGDLVAFHWENSDQAVLGVYEGATGRDYSGRFVKKGSPDECYAIDGLRFRQCDLQSGHFGILGKVIGPGLCGDIVPPSV